MKLTVLALFFVVGHAHRTISRDAALYKASAKTVEDPLGAPTDDVSDDYNSQTKIRIPGEVRPEDSRRHLPVSIECIVATLWCLMMASIPYVLAKYSEHDITTLVYCEGVGMLIWLVGGIAAFTQVILFQSAHWDGVRSLTMVESTYLLTQILTTIGYGDITPAFPRGQVVVGFYIVVSVLLVGNMFSQIVDLAQKSLESAKEAHAADITLDEDDEVVSARLKKSEEELLKDANEEAEPTGFEWVEPDEILVQPLLKAIVIYAVIAGVGILFFHLYPGENKSLLEAIYMSLVTLTTVGFGAFTATTEAGKAFASFWMLVGVAALGHFVNSVIDFSLRKKVKDDFCHHKEHRKWNDLIANMDKDHDGQIDSGEFMRFALVHAGYCTEEDIEKVQHFFRRMRPDKKGQVPMAKFQALGAPQRTPRSPRQSPR